MHGTHVSNSAYLEIRARAKKELSKRWVDVLAINYELGSNYGRCLILACVYFSEKVRP